MLLNSLFLYLYLAVRVPTTSANCPVRGILLMSLAGFLLIWLRFLHASDCQRLFLTITCQEHGVSLQWLDSSSACCIWQAALGGRKTSESFLLHPCSLTAASKSLWDPLHSRKQTVLSSVKEKELASHQTHHHQCTVSIWFYTVQQICLSEVMPASFWFIHKLISWGVRFLTGSMRSQDICSASLTRLGNSHIFGDSNSINNTVW